MPSIQLCTDVDGFFRIVCIQIQLRLYGHDQLVVSDNSAADGVQPARRVRRDLRNSAELRKERAETSEDESQHSGRHHPRYRAAPNRTWILATQPPERISRQRSRDRAPDSGDRESTTPANTKERMPTAPIGVPDSWDELGEDDDGSSGGRFRFGSDTRLRPEARPRCVDSCVPGKRQHHTIPFGVTSRRNGQRNRSLRQDQCLPRRHAGVLRRQD